MRGLRRGFLPARALRPGLLKSPAALPAGCGLQVQLYTAPGTDAQAAVPCDSAGGCDGTAVGGTSGDFTCVCNCTQNILEWRTGTCPAAY